jgi:hypothetical protein
MFSPLSRVGEGVCFVLANWQIGKLANWQSIKKPLTDKA